MPTITVWTATPNTNPTRFDGDGWLWASPQGVHYSHYGENVWEIVLEVDDDQRAYPSRHFNADKARLGQNLKGEWAIQRPPSGQWEYVFKASAIVTRRLLSKEEIVNTPPAGVYHKPLRQEFPVWDDDADWGLY